MEASKLVFFKYSLSLNMIILISLSTKFSNLYQKEMPEVYFLCLSQGFQSLGLIMGLLIQFNSILLFRTHYQQQTVS